MKLRAVLFDLDDTLVPERSAWDAAFTSACAGVCSQYSIEVDDLRREVFKAARELWQASPLIDWCRSVGFGVPSSLLSDFAGDGPELSYLREWTPRYRREVWSIGLASVGLADPMAPESLALAFREAFSAGHAPFDDVIPALDALGGYAFGVITNGESGLQRDKLLRSGLSRYFPLVFISGEVRVAKPHSVIFRAALDKLGIAPNEAVMVGDNIDRDIAGAHALGLHPVWLDRANAAKAPTVPHLRIDSLADLPSVVQRLSAWT